MGYLILSSQNEWHLNGIKLRNCILTMSKSISHYVAPEYGDDADVSF